MHLFYVHLITKWCFPQDNQWIYSFIVLWHDYETNLHFIFVWTSEWKITWKCQNMFSMESPVGTFRCFVFHLRSTYHLKTCSHQLYANHIQILIKARKFMKMIHVCFFLQIRPSDVFPGVWCVEGHGRVVVASSWQEPATSQHQGGLPQDPERG